ncbi:DUF5518 domain-containing protein [Halovenus salina]|uniref:DUF5518 domain-containing protein n=1 Tax=Halovenus salina TaxID=1510225 RepID=A0ABD5W3H9_9EURY
MLVSGWWHSRSRSSTSDTATTADNSAASPRVRTTQTRSGGVVTAFFSFVGISAVVGGALAGYLEGGGSDRTTTVGAVAGLLPALPALVIGLFTVVGLYSGLQDIGQTGPMVAGVGGILFGVLIYAGFNATQALSVATSAAAWQSENRRTVIRPRRMTVHEHLRS